MAWVEFSVFMAFTHAKCAEELFCPEKPKVGV